MMNAREKSIPIIVPVLVLPEISAAIARGQGKPELGIAFVNELEKIPNITFIDLDSSFADLAVDLAAKHRLRGSDAIYAAVALRFGAELVTLDRDQLERLPKVLSVRTP
ncbi:MAG: PIN domain-containing protein [Anaerolineales bacterium]|nr:PIN domain-containing protein [Anaerolineales bacterium]